MTRKLFVALMLVLAAAVAAPPAFALDIGPDSMDATAYGYVKDANNDPIVGATVTWSTTPELSTTTNSSGQYVRLVPAGTWDVTASKSGFQPETRYDVVYVSGQPKQVDFTLTAN